MEDWKAGRPARALGQVWGRCWRAGIVKVNLPSFPPSSIPILLLALALLTACALSPEEAAIQAVQESQGITRISPGTLQHLQTQPWQDGVMVLVSYQTLVENGQIAECVSLYEAQRQQLGWASGGGGGGCWTGGGHSEPIGIGAGQHSGNGRPGLSYVYGLVYDERVAAVKVTWDDGQEQQGEVVNGSYLVLRAGAHDYGQIRALDAEGNTIHTQPSPLPAPRKESRRPANHPTIQPSIRRGT
jgi:hypothetical protein